MYISENFIKQKLSRLWYVPGVTFARFEISKCVNNDSFKHCKKFKDKKKRRDCRIKALKRAKSKLSSSYGRCMGRRNEEKCKKMISNKIDQLNRRIDSMERRETLKSMSKYRGFKF